ncbi:hypothetical protein FRB95_012810 [Tulasnella sp. JGI-2019a]|nr:hypothetical protein FRB95_012810 [Tulasnella sp. JGI-2019a]
MVDILTHQSGRSDAIITHALNVDQALHTPHTADPLEAYPSASRAEASPPPTTTSVRDSNRNLLAAWLIELHSTPEQRTLEAVHDIICKVYNLTPPLSLYLPNGQELSIGEGSWDKIVDDIEDGVLSLEVGDRPLPSGSTGNNLEKNSFLRDIESLLQDLRRDIVQDASRIFQVELQKLRDQIDDHLQRIENNTRDLVWRLMRSSQLNNALLARGLQWSSSKTECGDNRIFKRDIYQFYHGSRDVDSNSSYPEQLQCAVLGLTLPATAVIATHIFKAEFEQELADLLEINREGPRNGLILYKPIAEAFDDSRLCFYQNANGRLAVRILDPAMLGEEIMGRSASKQIMVEGTEIQYISEALETIQSAGYVTWKTIQDQELALPEGKSPYTRILHFHARSAQNAAIERGWMQEGDWNLCMLEPGVVGLGVGKVKAWQAGLDSGEEDKDSGDCFEV